MAHVCFFEMSRSRCRPLKRTRFIGSYSRHFRAGGMEISTRVGNFAAASLVR